MVYTGERYRSAVEVDLKDPQVDNDFTVHVTDQFNAITHSHQIVPKGDKHNVYAVINSSLYKRDKFINKQQTMQGSRIQCYEHLLSLAANPKSAFEFFDDFQE